MMVASCNKSSSSSETNLLLPSAAWKLSSGQHESTVGLVGPSTGQPPKIHKCGTCDKVCLSSQALGGHMNAHKKRKAVRKQPMVHPHCYIQNPIAQSNILESPDPCVVNPPRLALSLPPVTQESACYYHSMVLSAYEMRPFYTYPSRVPGSKPIIFYKFLDSKLEEEYKMQQKSRLHEAHIDVDVKRDVTNVNLNMPPVASGNKESAACKRGRIPPIPNCYDPSPLGLVTTSPMMVKVEMN